MTNSTAGVTSASSGKADTSASTSAAQPPPDFKIRRVKIVVLGARGVGKSSIIRQFVLHRFDDAHSPTTDVGRCHFHYPTIVVNDHLYETTIVDCPPISYFPESSLREWTDFRGFGLRAATAYILVFDATSDESFHYVRAIREQIVYRRDTHNVPIIVAGNKHDLIVGEASQRRQTHNCSGAGNGGIIGGSSGISGGSSGITSGALNKQRELATFIRKSWKCGYVECSAKCNWHVMELFKELMKAIDTRDLNDHKKTTTSSRVQDVLRRGCLCVLQ